MIAPNETLRNYVTSVGFSLTLSKAQIELLVLLDHFGSHNALHRAGLIPSMYVPTIRALDHRGLTDIGSREAILTKAGRLAVELLREAGMYAEVLERKGVEEAAA
ncbi:MAG TPA: hypothetical protein PLB92_00585 [Rhodoglobus sp.]|nr:hypothetical protein [Rhodoglobus sp.]